MSFKIFLFLSLTNDQDLQPKLIALVKSPCGLIDKPPAPYPFCHFIYILFLFACRRSNQHFKKRKYLILVGGFYLMQIAVWWHRIPIVMSMSPCYLFPKAFQGCVVIQFPRMSMLMNCVPRPIIMC